MKFDLAISTKYGISEEKLEMAKRLIPVNKVLIDTSRPLGLSRQRLAERVTTPWFYYFDDDITLFEGFHQSMTRHMADDVGMIYPNVHAYFGEEHKWITDYEDSVAFIRRWLRRPDVAEKRAFAGATLVQTEAMRQILMPPVARVEDYWMQKEMKRLGYRVIYAKEILVEHNSSVKRLNRIYEIAWEEGYCMAYLDYVSRRRLYIAWLMTYPKSILAFLRTGNRKVFQYIGLYRLKLKGYDDQKAGPRRAHNPIP